jgi:autotransporter strand-loop-strand O-heptosyltransferase
VPDTNQAAAAAGPGQVPATQAAAPPAAPASASASVSASAAPASAASAPVKGPYPAPNPEPTQDGGHGIRFDFNEGCRVRLPAPPDGMQWRIVLKDLDTGNVIFATLCGATMVASRKRHYIRFGVEIDRVDAEGKSTPVLRHQYAAAGKDVAVMLPVGTLGDSMGWFPYALKFMRQHGCRLTVVLAEVLIPLFKPVYPDVNFVGRDAYETDPVRAGMYGSYFIGLFFDDEDNTWQPADFRLVGLHRTAGYILGVDPTEEPPRIAYQDDSRPIPEPYAVIAVQSSTQCKYWNNPQGWRAVVGFLKSIGLRVICIDRQAVHGTGLVWNHIPHGAEDQTGDRPLPERARWLKHAEVFIGLSSGLSWLAWAAGVPVVMISGFTHPTNEFHTPYRVFNTHVCNSCWNDVRHRFQHNNFFFCPRHTDTPRQFECTRLITPEHVISAIARVPAVAARIPPPPV